MRTISCMKTNPLPLLLYTRFLLRWKKIKCEKKQARELLRRVLESKEELVPISFPNVTGQVRASNVVFGRVKLTQSRAVSRIWTVGVKSGRQ